MKNILVTGAAGFIGFHLSKTLLDAGFNVYGLDNLNDYYSVKLKKDRIKKIQEYSKSSKNNSFTFQKVDISKKKSLENIFSKNKFEIVINLAAQAGVRYSFDNSEKYLISNLVGFHNLLECCRRFNIEHFLFASSSSVYGMSSKIPF